MPSDQLDVAISVDVSGAVKGLEEAKHILTRLEAYAAERRTQKPSWKKRLMQPTQRPEILPYLIAVIAVLGIIGLTILGDKVPEVLNQIAMGTVVGGAAISRSSPPAPPA